MNKPTIEITIGCDWGCEHSSEDGDRYAMYVAAELSRLYPACDVFVGYDEDLSGRDQVDLPASVPEYEICDVLQQCWESWNDAGMP